MENGRISGLKEAFAEIEKAIDNNIPFMSLLKRLRSRIQRLEAEDRQKDRQIGGTDNGQVSDSPIAFAVYEIGSDELLDATLIKPEDESAGLRFEPLYARPEAVTIDPGTEKILRTLLDRAYAMMAMSGYRVAEVNADHNNPIIAWMSDAAAVLYGSGRRPDPVADLQGTPRSPRGEKNHG